MPPSLKEDLVCLERFKSTEEIEVKLISYFVLFGHRSDTDVRRNMPGLPRVKTGSRVKVKDQM